MSALFAAELRKVWANRLFLLMLAALAAGNLLLLWMGTQPTSTRPAPAAYKAVGSSMDGMTMEEKGQFLQTQLEMANSLYTIDRYYKNELIGFTPGEYKKEYADAFAQYEDAYKNKSYTLYTGNFATEIRLMQQLWDEYCTVRDYPQFLQQIQEKASQLAGISIFQQSGYNTMVIQATANAYAGMEDVPLFFYPQQGLYTALQYPFTDLLLLASMLVLALFLVRHERDNGLLQLVRTLPGGRLRTALAKMGAFAASLLAVAVVLYGVNLAYCQLAFGLGPLARSIQSVAELQRCTMQVSVGKYLFFFLLAKWGSAFVLGLWVLLASLLPRHQLAGWAMALLLPLGMYGVRAAIPATSNLNVLKYANLASLLQTNELLGRYRCLYWFGTPVTLPLVECIAAVLFAVLFFVGFCLLFACAKLPESRGKIALPTFGKKTRPTTVWREEGRKLWQMQAGALVLAAFVIFGVYRGVVSESYITAEEYFYAQYMKAVSGPYTEQSRDKLVEMGKEFIPLVQALRRIENGQPGGGDALIYNLLPKYTVYTRVLRHNVNDYLTRHPNAWLVYDTGYKKLFGFDTAGQNDVQDALYAGLLCAVCFSGLFAMERRGGMETVLRCTPLGRRHTVRAKLGQSALLAVLTALAICVPHLWQILRDYGLPELAAPAMSIAVFETLPEFVPLWGVLLFWFVCRAVACMVLGVIGLWLGQRLKNALASILVCTAVYCLPPLLSLSGMKGGIEWLSVWPLFHAAALLGTQSSSQLSFAWIPILLLVLAVLLIWAMAQAFFLTFESANE